MLTFILNRLHRLFCQGHQAKWRRRNAFAALMLLTLIGGCWSSSTGPVLPPVKITPEKPTVPEVTQTLDQVRQEMILHDRYSPEFDAGRVKMAVLQDKSRREHGVEGFKQQESPPGTVYSSPTAVADAKTGRVAWRAMTCCNPKCTAVGRGGGPFLFTLEYSWITVGPDGKIQVGPPNIEEMNRPVYCPACKSGEYIRFYDIPETAVRERALKDELKQSYRAYAAAAKEKRAKPSDIRSPDEIIKEIEALPKVYLVSEPGKVKAFDAVVAPVSSGPGGTP